MKTHLVLHTPAQRYAFAAGVSAVALSVMFAMDRIAGYGMFQVGVVGVVLTAWYGGLGPGLLSALLTGFGIIYFFLDPRYTLDVPPWEQGLQLLVFTFVAVLMSSLSEARYRAESRLRTRSEQLEAANQELEAFSYSVSHDLRWPLRAIDGYSRILLDDYAAHLDGKARRYLEHIRESTQQMDHLVEDLLAFSRLGRQPLHRQPVFPAEVVRQVLDELRPERTGREIEIVVGELPPCEADPRLLKQVFMNLLQNAHKFTRRREQARIEVGAQVSDNGCVYSVKDNGVGFDMKYAEKVFGVFQRLHAPEEYEGTGVGLAIVQRIIQRHAGRIWVESDLDKGTTFFFTIGKEER
ncbi:ATP-binding protein [Candidatus Nitrospira bockiana]